MYVDVISCQIWMKYNGRSIQNYVAVEFGNEQKFNDPSQELQVLELDIDRNVGEVL